MNQPQTPEVWREIKRGILEEFNVDPDAHLDNQTFLEYFNSWCGRNFQEANLVRSYDEVNWTYIPRPGQGMGVHAYSESEDENLIRVFYIPLVGRHTGADDQPIFEFLFGPLLRFVEDLIGDEPSRLMDQLEMSRPEYDLAQKIRTTARAKRLKKIILTAVTNRRVPNLQFESYTQHDIVFEFDVWDLKRLHTLYDGTASEVPRVVDLIKEHGGSIPCLPVPNEDERYNAYLAAFPGKLLSQLYELHGEVILEANVRTFLQAKGQVNKDIQHTLKSDPGMFFAFNNGLSTVVSRVELDPNSPTPAIARLHDLQIVNGAQTTGSVHLASRTHIHSGNVRVAVKITEIPEDFESRVDVVGDICRFANTQNSVKTSDHYSKLPIHVQLERLSRSLSAPPAFTTHWFYERMRGQYEAERAKLRNASDKKAFEARYPKKQILTKTDVAKLFLCWRGLPHRVSHGAQKNFEYFMDKWLPANDGTTWKPDREWFKKVVALKLLYDHLDDVTRKESAIRGYKAQVIYYVIALLNELTGPNFDLLDIWEQQRVPTSIHAPLTAWCLTIYNLFLEASGGLNVTEWCKRKQSWDKIKESELPLIDQLVTRTGSTSGTCEVKPGAVPLSTRPTESGHKDLDSVLGAPEPKPPETLPLPASTVTLPETLPKKRALKPDPAAITGEPEAVNRSADSAPGVPEISTASKSTSRSQGDPAKDVLAKTTPKPGPEEAEDTSFYEALTRNNLLALRAHLGDKKHTKASVRKLVEQNLIASNGPGSYSEIAGRIVDAVGRVVLAPEDFDEMRRKHMSSIRKIFSDTPEVVEADVHRVIVYQCLKRKRATRNILQEAAQILDWAEDANLVERRDDLVIARLVEPGQFTAPRLAKILAKNLQAGALFYESDLIDFIAILAGLNRTKRVKRAIPKIVKQLIDTRRAIHRADGLYERSGE